MRLCMRDRGNVMGFHKFLHLERFAKRLTAMSNKSVLDKLNTKSGRWIFFSMRVCVHDEEEESQFVCVRVCVCASVARL